ncbi:hypothetical protein K7432_005864 [Basidiobolus ranarum]|uniref:Dynamin-type G domain-containing protein n=1 Tax=Basidiobolus ranarum TaxID=34480 RepID=A0ABR2WVR7_9FUNG
MPMKSALTSSFLESSKFKKRHSVLIKLVDAMRDCGANLDLDIPTIVFCGNQSAGKSSLIEAISEIELPRSDGTCTRCPMEVRLSTSSSSWECVVSLRKEYDTNGKILDRPQEKYFGSVKAKKDVGLLVIRAQRALLNPERATDFFACVNLDDSPDDLQFTKNVVVLHIKGADIDLSLIDLPGIIRSVDDPNDNHLIPLVRSLVQVYIEKPKTIIVATISCKDDIDNQEVIQMAKSADPEGLRTLGVLTKPDTIELHCEAVWLELLKGLKYKLALGYTMVRNPSKKELLDGLTRTEARNLENQFFESTEPWRSLERDHKCQLGVANLSSELSDLLVRLIEINLPIMRETLQNSMESVDEQLSKLPRPLASNLQREYLDALQSLREHLDDVVSAKKNKDLYQAIMKESEEFFERIRQTRPKFVFGDKAPNDKDKLTYTDVQKLIRERKGRELPGHTSPEVTAEIIKVIRPKYFMTDILIFLLIRLQDPSKAMAGDNKNIF